jgi:hypothetical protein
VTREQAIEAMTQILMEAADDISEEDAKKAATMAVDRAIKQRGG